MTGIAHTQRIPEWLIRAACRRLPADVRGERRCEWTAELPAILGDESIRPPFRRGLQALAFCVGICWATRQLSLSARAGARSTRNSQWRTGALRSGPSDIVGRVVAGLAVEIAVVASFIFLSKLLLTGPDKRPWPLLIYAVVGIVFVACCLADLARAADVRYLAKWKWALICVIQIPLGGILYLTIGRVGTPRSAPPSDARP